jgi:hypothetical protein
MAADGAGLIVPTGSRLTALGPGRSTPGVENADKHPGRSTRMTAYVSRRWFTYGQHVQVTGSVSRNDGSQVSDRLELQAATYPYRVWRTVRSTYARYGGYSLGAAPDRNTRYRVVDTDTYPGVRSAALQVRLQFGFDFRSRYAGGSRVAFDVRIVAPPFFALDKGPLYYYSLRNRRSRGDRIGHLPLKRTGKGRYRSRGTLKVPNLKKVGWFLVCVKLERWHDIYDFRRKPPCGGKHI